MGVIDPVLLSLFVVATIGYIFTPGPVVALIVAETLRDGPKHGFAAVLGATLVGIIYLAISFFAFSLVANLPATVLDGIRYAGAAYLYYLAYQSFSQTVATDSADLPPKKGALFASFTKSAMVCFTSPKTILFFAAFFPQFVDKTLPIEPQLAVLSVTFFIIAFGVDSTWMLLAAKAKKWLTQKDKLTVANKIAGSVLAAGATFLLLIN